MSITVILKQNQIEQAELEVEADDWSRFLTDIQTLMGVTWHIKKRGTKRIVPPQYDMRQQRHMSARYAAKPGL